jgi:nucleoid-associated protein YgaU
MEVALALDAPALVDVPIAAEPEPAPVETTVAKEPASSVPGAEQRSQTEVALALEAPTSVDVPTVTGPEPAAEPEAVAETPETVTPEGAVQPRRPTVIDADADRFAGGRVVIRRGDTLWEIADRVYGKGWWYKKIWRANRDQIRRPSRIYPGQVFEIPAVKIRR